jgi:2-haloacid dehalogenase
MREPSLPSTNGNAPVVVFDFGGVLMDWNPRHLYRKLFPDEATMEQFLAEIDFDAWNLEQDRGRPFHEGVEVLCARFPGYRPLIEAYHLRWEESIAGPIPESIGIVHELHGAGYRLLGLSNWSSETFGIVRSKHDFFDFFETIVLSGEVRLAKPEPEIFHLLLDRVGLRADDCLFIDDSAANIQTAAALGFDVIRFESPAVLREELADRGLVASEPAASPDIERRR